MPETSPSHRANSVSITLFILIVLLGGSNSVAIRFSNQELAPFWGATLRFGVAALVFWLILWIRRLSLPTVKDAVIITSNGFLSVGVSFALIYWALIRVPVSLATILISTGPLFTFLLAVLHRLEKFRAQVLIGGAISIFGMAIAVNAQPGGAAGLLPSILALILAALVGAEGNVIFKIYALKGDSAVINALSLSSGTLFLTAASFFAGETWTLPTRPEVWVAVTYLILGGSVATFYMFVSLLVRWTASAASYTILCFPLVATVLAAWLAKETVTLMFLLGGVIVILGVWVGAFLNINKS